MSIGVSFIGYFISFSLSGHVWITNVLLSCRSSEARQQTKQGFHFYYRLFGENFDPINGHGYSREMLTCAAVSRDAPLIDSLILFLVVVFVAPCIPLNTKHKEILLKNQFHGGSKLSITGK